MERTRPVEGLDYIKEVIEALANEYGHSDGFYCILCDYDHIIQEIEKVETILKERPNWNKELHERYLEVLDERDTLQGYLDQIREIGN